MIQTLNNDKPDFSWGRVFGILTKLAILGALLYAGKCAYDTITKDTPKLASQIGPDRIGKMIHSNGR